MAEKLKTEIKQFLSFKLDNEIFAIDVARVREVVEIFDITRIPRMPSFMRGVINLRSSVVPVIDLRLKFNLPAKEFTVDSCIIVLEVEIAGEKLTIGAIADSVREVFDLPLSEIEPPPQIGTRLNTDFLVGMAKLNKKFIMILNIDKIFSSEELIIISKQEKRAKAQETNAV